MNKAKNNLKKSELNTIKNYGVGDSGVNKSNKSNLNKIPSEGVLIVTMKNKIEEWADIIRSMPEPSLYMYTNALASRRKVGAYNLAQYDVVITTFDVRTFRLLLVLYKCCQLCLYLMIFLSSISIFFIFSFAVHMYVMLCCEIWCYTIIMSITLNSIYYIYPTDFKGERSVHSRRTFLRRRIFRMFFSPLRKI